MKKNCLRIIALALAMVLLHSAALAEISRGDRGEEVFDLQLMLADMGWLFEEPDGIFGKNTLQAVKDFEAAHNFPADGIADEAVFEAIGVAWDAMMSGQSNGVRAEESSGAYNEAIRLNSNIIISGERIYYSGAVNGTDPGVYVIDAYTRNARKISDIQAQLMALCNENLLVLWHRDWTDDAVLAVLEPDGNTIPLTYPDSGYGIEACGRFHWGAGSCNWDGSDLQTHFSEDKADLILPLTVDGDFLYYEDGNALGDRILYRTEANHLPVAQLWRMNLSDGSRQMIGDTGSRFLGLEEGKLYFAAENYWAMDETGSEIKEYCVAEGLHCVDTETLQTLWVAESKQSENSSVRWKQLEEGIIYGCSASCSHDAGWSEQILRIRTDGSILPSLPRYSGNSVMICIADGTWYATAVTEEDCEILICIDLESGSRREIPFEEDEVLYFSDSRPQLAVADGVIYYYCYDGQPDAYCLKSMDLHGGDKALYAFSSAA